MNRHHSASESQSKSDYKLQPECDVFLVPRYSFADELVFFFSPGDFYQKEALGFVDSRGKADSGIFRFGGYRNIRV